MTAVLAVARYLRLLEAWDPAKHPRGPDGRFIRKDAIAAVLGTATAAAGTARRAAGTSPRRRRRPALTPSAGLAGLAVGELTNALQRVSADDENAVRGALAGRSRAELTQIAQALPTVRNPQSRRKAQIADRQRARAIGGFQRREAVRDVARFDPNQPRDPDGKWTDVPGIGAIRDALKLAGRIELAPGESLAGSASLDANDGTVVPMALTRSAAGPRLRIGMGIAGEDAGRWRGANRGSTAILDPAGMAQLRAAVDEMADAGERGVQREDQLWQRVEQLRAQEREVIRRQYPHLTKAQAIKLDKIDERIEELTERLEREQAHRRDAIHDLPPQARAQWDQLDTEIAALSRQRDEAINAFWASGGNDKSHLDRFKQLDNEIVELIERQTGLHDARETSSRKVGFASMFHRRERKIAELEQDLERARVDRDELTGDAQPLPTADQAELATLRTQLQAANDEHSQLIQGMTVAQGVIPGQWADLVYQTDISDVGAGYRIGVRPHSAPADWDFPDDEGYTDFDADDLARLRGLLDTLTAAGVSESVAVVEAGRFALKRFWTKDPEGLAKWASKPHPWTALYRQLVKHMPAALARRVASQWFHDVFGIWPGERKGGNPVGPG